MNKRWMALLFVVLLLFSACGTNGEGEASPAPSDGIQPETEPRATTSDNTQPETEPSPTIPQAFSLTEGAVDGLFGEGSMYEYDQDYSGYSCHFTVYTWLGMQGRATPVLHPYDNELSIPAQRNTDYMAPFAVTLEVTTGDSAYFTDVRVTVETFNFRGSRQSYIVDSTTLEERVAYGTEQLQSAADNGRTPTKETLAEYIYMGNGIHFFDYKELEAGSTHYIVGYGVLPDYYSPAHPDGNREMLGDKGYELRLETYIHKLTGSDSKAEYSTSLID